MADAFKKILANRCAFFFAHRFTIPTNQASHGMIWSEDTGIACEVFAWSGDLHGQTFEKLAAGHRKRSGAIAPRTFEGVSKSAVAAQGEAFGGDRATSQVASEPFETLAIIGVDGHVCVQGIRVESHVSGTHNRPVIGLLGAIGRDTELDGTSTRSRSTCALSLGSGGIEFALAVGETDCVLRLKRYTNPKVLVIDELGYLRYDNRFADIFFEVVRLRYENRVPIVLTTNKGFSEWIQIFESAACLVTLIDRLCHHSDIVQIAGESYRLKEAMQRSESRDAKRKKAKSNKS